MLTDILSLFKQGKSTARSHVKNLIEMAAVDGNFDSSELDLLKSIAKRNGISEGQLSGIRKNPEGIKFEIPDDVKEKFEQFYDLVHMMIVDKNIHEEEVNLCNLFAVKFGYKREIIKELVESIRINIQNNQTSSETMKRLSLLIG